MKSILYRFRFWGILLLMIFSGTCLFAQRRGMFRLLPDLDLSLSLEQYQEMASAALASIEKEKPKYLQFIDTEVAPDFAGRIYQIDDEEKTYITSSLPFYGMESDTRYCKILFPCKAKHAKGFSEGNVAVVYVRTKDYVPFCIEWGDSHRELILKYDKLPSLKKASLAPASWVIPNGKAELEPEVRDGLGEKARRAVKENLPDVYDELILNAIPLITRILYYEGEKEARPGFRVSLFGRGVKLLVSVWEDSGETFDICLDKP